MSKQFKWALTIFSIGVFMAALDNGIVTASLTTLNKSFQVPPNWGAWIITIYTLGLSISVPIVGKLSDRFGRKRLFLIEITLFGLGSFLVSLSPHFWFLLVARFIQSMGGGGIFILASSYILNVYPKEKQGRALGMLGGMNGIAAILGPNIGSFILQTTGSWHWLFLINLPIAVLLFIFGFMYINEEQELIQAKLDWIGILLLSTGILSFMYSLTNLEGVNILNSILKPKFYIFLIVGIILLVLLFNVEKNRSQKGIDPILPVSLFKFVTYRWTLLLAAFSGAILASVIFIPGYIEQYLGVKASLSGYLFTPLAIASGVGAGSGGAITDKKGPIQTLIIAAILTALGFLLLPIWVGTIWQMIIATSFIGLGFGMMLGAPINVLATENTEHDKGIALGTSSLFRQIGMTIAPTIYAGFLARSFKSFGTVAKEKFKAAHFPFNQQMMQHMPKNAQIADIKHSIEQIPVPQVRKILLEVIHDVVGKGYNGLFYAGLAVAVLMLVSVFILSTYRHPVEDNQVEVEEEQH